ncbi:hypothetical protein [Flavobacterium hungaricum]|uniref:Uncharacterized protein n=1 Tax=Flavobacterium hungaricum TaxID=2082725 RepID=A0ABR9TMF7_9FLAO|nr:hypothetical protein [Flavobacterium hungaricum]MBE8726518.1 hypothetical protein [Flavobacterium hungaricum]
MSFSLTYSLLFEVTIFHNYFLNNGEEIFAGMNAAAKEKMLQNFNIDSFAVIAPSAQTNTVLKNYKMIFKTTKTGFKVYVKVKETDDTDPFVKIPAALNLQFIISIKEYQFENYTNLDDAANQIFLFSNVKPAAEPDTFQYISKINDTKLISNDYLVSKVTTAALMAALPASQKQDVFGIISLNLQGDAVSGNIITNAGKIVHPNFKIHFDNRKTFWKYINHKASTAIETNAAKPLTRSGFVEIDPLLDFTPPQAADSHYPNPSVKSILKIDGDFYSEIFI